jgi:hypothetical protein
MNQIDRLERKFLTLADLTDISFYTLREDEDLAILILQGKPNAELREYIANYYDTESE